MSRRKPSGRRNLFILKPSPPNAFVLGALLIYPGLAVHTVTSMTTGDLLKIGLWWPLILSACLVPAAIFPVLILRAIVTSLSRRGRWPLWLGSKTILGVASAISLALAGAGLYSATPRQRYLKLVGNGDNDGASEIKASGFNSFLATRWLVTFKIDQQGAERIRTRWELEETKPFSLKERIARDPVFSSSGSALLAEPPGAQGVKCFIKKSDSTKTSTKTWITFAVRDSDGQAWFFRGYQN
ncbi:hypothetical protein OJ996_21475 [Luteolibacter sp. GHJ8]|uniref:Uncharacterized protein n=1 Tax=Luteolibacter rhizosphaerae TaxID=2989719 RepID=A0ABT3GAC0_9BACT|nr:hypothetical protein [Luteolibacter rhizosphaerae]MCW1916175.1 hypothetical protein [Luteolibacter rhizosphaerae]